MLASTAATVLKSRSRSVPAKQGSLKTVLVAIGALALLAGAGGGTSSESIAPMSATGNCVGRISNFGTPTTMTVLLLDKTGTVTSQGFANMNLKARVSSTSWDGLLNGSGFLNQAITLTRQ